MKFNEKILVDAATSLLLLAVVVGISCAAGALNVSNALVAFSDVVVVVASDVVVVVVSNAVGAACRKEVAVAVGAASREVAVAVVVVLAAQKFSSSVLFRLVAEAMPREAKQSQCPADLPTAGGNTKFGTRVTGEESRQRSWW